MSTDTEQLQTLSDELLWQSAINGSSEAEELLVKRFTRLVRASARPLFLAGGDSEDLIQEGMMGLVQAIRTYNAAQGAAFSTYATTCIRNRLITAVKSYARHKHTPLNSAISFEYDLPGVSHRADTTRDLEDQILAKEQADTLRTDASRALSRFEHQVLSLFLDGLSYEEMAIKTGKPTKSVDNAIYRIRKKLGTGETSHG